MNPVELKLTCLRLVWPAGIPNVDVQMYLDQAQKVYDWVLKGDIASPAPNRKKSPDTATAPGQK